MAGVTGREVIRDGAWGRFTQMWGLSKNRTSRAVV